MKWDYKDKPSVSGVPSITWNPNNLLFNKSLLQMDFVMENFFIQPQTNEIFPFVTS